MKTVAAVLVETRRPLEIVDLELPALRAGQVLVEIAVSGVCQTQLLEARGLRGPDAWLPHGLGHEGAGTVLEIGPGVTRCQPGERVILSWIKAGGRDAGGSVAAWNGQNVNAGPITTFSRHAVISENRLTPIDNEYMAFEQAALLGCAGATGLGAVWRAANVRPGETVAVFGLGGVGLCAVQAASIAGAGLIIGIDKSAARLALAQQMGVHSTYDVSRASEGVNADIAGAIVGFTGGGVDYAIEATGRPEVMAQALASVRPRGGAAIIVGNAPFGQRLEIDPKQLNQGKRLLGTWGGDTEPDVDFPRFFRLYECGKLILDPLLGNSYPLSRANEALADLEHQRVARPLIDMRL
jgi:S-(hydroxymethyl)glutathione dehydrogenase/alcohol dehydrogenase